MRAAVFLLYFSAICTQALAQQPPQAPPPSASQTLERQAPAGKTPITKEDLRPPASMLVDCAHAPKEAVTTLPSDLSAWATVYCTKDGAIFSPNENFYGVFPDSKIRAAFSAAELDSLKEETRASAYFKSITYKRWGDSSAKALVETDPLAAKIIKGKLLYRLDLTTNNNNSLSFLVLNPQEEPFWVFPLTDNGLGSPAFFVVSLATLNRTH